jgi:hypothetical protein
MSTKQNDRWAEEMKQQISTALQAKDFCKADQLNKELLDGVGYCLNYDNLREPIEDERSE